MSEEYKERIQKLIDGVFIKKENTVVVSEPIQQKEKFSLAVEKIFKIDESVYDVPHFVTENEESDLHGSQYSLVKPPSSFVDCDNYWNSMFPHLKRIGKVVPFANSNGKILLKVYDDSGKMQNLYISLVKDNTNDKPSLMLYYENGNITSDEGIKFIEKSGLKCDRLNAKKLNNCIIVDATI